MIAQVHFSEILDLVVGQMQIVKAESGRPFTETIGIKGYSAENHDCERLFRVMSI